MKIEQSFNSIILSLKIIVIDDTKTIETHLNTDESAFSNIHYYKTIEQMKNDNNYSNTNIIVINHNDQNNLEDIVQMIDENEDISFLLLTSEKNYIKYKNVITLSNLKNIDQRIDKLYKQRYKENKLFLKFSNNIVYNLADKVLLEDNAQISLTQREFELLELLLNNVDNVVPHKNIQVKIWHASYEVSDSAYKSLLNKLRSKIGKKTLKNVSGKGYMLNLQ